MHSVLDTAMLLDALGFITHPEKSFFIPSQVITILGFTIYSVLMKVFPTMEKIAKLKCICNDIFDVGIFALSKNFIFSDHFDTNLVEKFRLEVGKFLD